jgi:uncharacterized membrane protein YqjE
MDESSDDGQGALSGPGRMLRTLLDVAENRVELFLLESKEQRLRFFDALLLAAAGVVCALMTLLMITLTVVVVFWDTHRLLVMVLFAIVYAGASVAALGALRSRLRKWQAFTATLEEFKKDIACFKRPN